MDAGNNNSGAGSPCRSVKIFLARLTWEDYMKVKASQKVKGYYDTF